MCKAPACIKTGSKFLVQANLVLNLVLISFLFVSIVHTNFLVSTYFIRFIHIGVREGILLGDGKNFS